MSCSRREVFRFELALRSSWLPLVPEQWRGRGSGLPRDEDERSGELGGGSEREEESRREWVLVSRASD